MVALPALAHAPVATGTGARLPLRGGVAWRRAALAFPAVVLLAGAANDGSVGALTARATPYW